MYSHNAFFIAALITFINVYIAYGIRSFRVKSTLDAKPAQHSYGYDKMILDVSKFVFAESALSVCILGSACERGEVIESMPTSKVLSNAVNTNNCFVVPKVVE